MYTIQQLQAADYFLKSILGEKSDINRNLKFIIELNNTLWYGDFVNFQNDSVVQCELINKDPCSVTYSTKNTTFIEKLWTAYNANPINVTPLINPKYLELLFTKILEIIEKSNIQPDDSPIYPYLLNAKSLDGRWELPFIDLRNEKVKVISLMEIKNYTK